MLIIAGNSFAAAIPFPDGHLQSICSSKLVCRHRHNPGGQNILCAVNPGLSFCCSISGAEKMVVAHVEPVVLREISKP